MCDKRNSSMNCVYKQLNEKLDGQSNSRCEQPIDCVKAVKKYRPTAYLNVITQNIQNSIEQNIRIGFVFSGK